MARVLTIVRPLPDRVTVKYNCNHVATSLVKFWRGQLGADVQCPVCARREWGELIEGKDYLLWWPEVGAAYVFTFCHFTNKTDQRRGVFARCGQIRVFDRTEIVFIQEIER